MLAVNLIPEPAKIFILALTIFTINLWAAPQIQAQEESLIQAFILFDTTSNTAQTYTQAQTIISATQGHTTHSFPNQALIANISPAIVQSLAELPHVVGVFTQPVELSTLDVYGPKARLLANIWNSLTAPSLAAVERSIFGEDHNDDQNDSFVAP